MKRCFYDAPIKGFLGQSVEESLGLLSKDNSFDLTLEQRDAWLEEIDTTKGLSRELSIHSCLISASTIPHIRRG